MKTRFAQPILGCCVIVELTAVGARRFISVETFESAVVTEVDFVVVIDRDSTRADCLVDEASVVKIR